MTFNEFLDFISSDNPSAANQSSIILTKSAGNHYSSLAQIKNFPIDTLKVDRSFIRNIPNATEDKAITEAIIAMGKTLSLTIVAEGVETQEQMVFLRERSCDEMQGYYFSKPITPNQFAELLRTHIPSSQE